MHLGIWEGDVNESLPGSLPGACPPGHIHAVIYKWLTPAIYTQLVGCLLWTCTLERTWCGRWLKLWTRRYGRHNNRTAIPTFQSLHSRGHISDSQLTWELCECGLLAKYHNLRKSIRTFENRLVHAFGIQRRLNPATPDTVRDCISQQLNLPLHPMLYSQSQRPSNPFQTYCSQ